jgi:serine/threonine-protein phosphatase with EF-hand domain
MLCILQVITIFSSSNYYEIGSNKGAYIKFGANSDRYFVQFTAAASKTKKLTFRQQVDNVEKSAIRELKEKLRDQKIQLQNEFKLRDSDNTGTLFYIYFMIASGKFKKRISSSVQL